MVFSKATPAAAQGLTSVATQRAKNNLKKAAQENELNCNIRKENLEAKQQVFLAYNQVFTGDNARARSHMSVSYLVEKHFGRQKHITGSLEFENVVRLTRSILVAGWMEPGSEQRQKLKQLTDSERGSNEAGSITDAHTASLSAVQSLFYQVKDYLAPYHYLYWVPVHLPPKIQHKLLTSLQEKLEQCCFRYFKNNFPEILEERGWEDEADGELNLYSRIVCTRDVSSRAIYNHKSLAKLFGRLSNIRHAAVHRPKNLPVQVLAGMSADALSLAKVFRDRELVMKLQPWYDCVQYLSQDAMKHAQEHKTSVKLVKDQMRQLQRHLSNAKEKLRTSQRPADANYQYILEELEGFEAALRMDISKFEKGRYTIDVDDLLDLAELLGYDYNHYQAESFCQTYSGPTFKNLKYNLRDWEERSDDQLFELTQTRIRSGKFKSFDKKEIRESTSKSMLDRSREGHQMRNISGNSDTKHSPFTEQSPGIRPNDISEPPKRVHDAAFGESEDEQGEKMRPARKRQSTDNDFAKISKDEFDMAVIEAQHSKPILGSTEVIGENSKREAILTQQQTEITTETQEGIIATTSNTIERGLTIKRTNTLETETTLKEGSAMITAPNKLVIAGEDAVSTQKETTTREVGTLENIDTVREQSGEGMSETEGSLQTDMSEFEDEYDSGSSATELDQMYS